MNSTERDTRIGVQLQFTNGVFEPKAGKDRVVDSIRVVGRTVDAQRFSFQHLGMGSEAVHIAVSHHAQIFLGLGDGGLCDADPFLRFLNIQPS